MSNTKIQKIIENPINTRVKIALLWLFIMFGILFHTQFELSEIFVKTDIRIKGSNGEMPESIHLFRLLIVFLPLLLSLGALYFEKKAFKIFSLIYALLFLLLNIAHLAEEVMVKDKLDLSQITLLSLVVWFNILLVSALNKWRIGKKKVKKIG